MEIFIKYDLDSSEELVDINQLEKIEENIEYLAIFNGNKFINNTDFSKFTNLLELDIEHNNLIYFDATKLRNLKTLNISDNNLTEFYYSENLESLDISHNKLTHFSMTEKLLYLNISYNNLTILDLCGNQFGEINARNNNFLLKQRIISRRKIYLPSEIYMNYEICYKCMKNANKSKKINVRTLNVGEDMEQQIMKNNVILYNCCC